MSEIKRPELPTTDWIRTDAVMEAYGLAMQRYGMLLAAEICEVLDDGVAKPDYLAARIRAEADKLTSASP
jgi:hypothetical protein